MFALLGRSRAERSGVVDGTRTQRPLGALVSRRKALAVFASAFLPAAPAAAPASESVSFGLNPLFLDSDIELLSMIGGYLRAQLGRPVQLVRRRTYQEITALLLSGQLDAAWVCDDPYVQHEDQLELLATPVYKGEPLYQTYVAVNENSSAQTFDDLKGTVHAFSDPDSTSGYLVTRYLLAVRHETPASFFRESFFTYGHRNVVRAVASGLAESGSVDGYVWEVMRKREPDLIDRTRVVYRSERLGFPPIVCPKTAKDTEIARGIARAFLEMRGDPQGRKILGILQLDGFTSATPDLYSGTLEKWRLVKAQS
jgi:phosphonate transport system substrate-binding protein